LLCLPLPYVTICVALRIRQCSESDVQAHDDVNLVEAITNACETLGNFEGVEANGCEALFSRTVNLFRLFATRLWTSEGYKFVAQSPKHSEQLLLYLTEQLPYWTNWFDSVSRHGFDSATLDMIRALLHAKVDIESRNQNGLTPLLLAASRTSMAPSAELCAILLRYGADVNARVQPSSTPNGFSVSREVGRGFFSFLLQSWNEGSVPALVSLFSHPDPLVIAGLERYEYTEEEVFRLPDENQSDSQWFKRAEFECTVMEYLNRNNIINPNHQFFLDPPVRQLIANHYIRYCQVRTNCIRQRLCYVECGDGRPLLPDLIDIVIDYLGFPLRPSSTTATTALQTA
jgi:hypothetical protein